MHSLPSLSNLVRGCDCYCLVPGLELPAGSFLIGHPCEVIEIDSANRPWSPYRVAIKEGFRKTDVVLATYWASADIEAAKYKDESETLFPIVVVDRYVGRGLRHKETGVVSGALKNGREEKQIIRWQAGGTREKRAKAGPGFANGSELDSITLVLDEDKGLQV